MARRHSEEKTSSEGPRSSQPARRWQMVSGALALSVVLDAAPVFAQTPPATPPAAAATEAKPAEEAKGPNAGRVSISAGVDWTTAYFFRGIKQETEDLILQPYGEV